MSAHWKAYPTAEATAEACATHIVSVLETGMAGGGSGTLALSGGSTPKIMFGYMVRSGFDWSRVQVFWVDERGVPPTHPDSNYAMTEEFLIRPARIPQRNVHRIHAELPPDIAARRYEEEIREVFMLEPGEMPHFDVVHLGVGPDGHTASLFPGEPLIENRDSIVAAVHAEKMKQWRITLLPGVLLSARHAAVLVSGADKAETMRKVIHDQYTPLQVPAQIIAHHSRRASWFLDDAAAALLG
ncbi:MAG: 6-phosphogluconolactonase [Bryobacteraceae bacterium]|nr:6-phosphogluconolactonase [Bryobacteraceae bacterium]